MTRGIAKKRIKTDLAVAKRLWPNQLSRIQLENLKSLCTDYRFSVAAGDLLLLEGRWYVTHSGLMKLSRRNNCSGICVQPVPQFCDVQSGHWVFKATVHRNGADKGFVGYGDADPSNVSSLVRGAEMRVAETRAVNRALRKAYGIGLCSVEELGSRPCTVAPPQEKKSGGPPNGNGSTNGQPSLRDKLCLLIRKYELDPNLVKRYAADFCGTQELRDASRDLVEAFVSTVAEEAAKDRAALVCKLNSYSQPTGGAVMKRHFPGLHVEHARSERFPGRHLPGASGPRLLSLAPAEALLHPQLHGSGASGLRLPQDCGATLLHPEVPLETELVSAGFRL